MSYTLAIDQGTQSSRAVLFDSEGEIVARQQQAISINRIKKDHVEQDAEEILNSVKKVIDYLLSELSSAQRKSISACGICTQRSSVVACDRQGQALSPVIGWQDTRESEWLHSLRNDQETIQSISGLPLTPHYGASKLRWLNGQVTTRNDNQMLLAPLVSYLLLNLINENSFFIDHSNAQRTQLMDIQTLDWSATLLGIFNVPQSSLPKCKPVVFSYGDLLDTGIKVQAVCGDQNAVFSGAGNGGFGIAVLNLGTGAFIMCLQSQRPLHGNLLTTIIKSDDQAAVYALEGTVNGAGSALNWANEKYDLGDLKVQLPGWLASVDHPPVFINSIGGIGSPWWANHITPQFFDDSGNERQHGKAEIAVAVIESIVFLIMDNLSLMQQDNAIKRIQVSGGLSSLDGLCQKLANLSGL
ncbi:MAG TPA: hypothetical protein DD827_01400, partial [Gammaproteobacteria bacterium]|nr:hypothetical protein [Gammaproteobacteria bacterium]